MTLKEARKKRNLKQVEVAKIMGVSTSQISQWESGVNKITAKKLFELCDILRVSRDDIKLPE